MGASYGARTSYTFGWISVFIYIIGILCNILLIYICYFVIFSFYHCFVHLRLLITHFSAFTLFLLL